MSDGTPLNPGIGGNTIFDKDNGDGTHTSMVVLSSSTTAPFETPTSAAAPVYVGLSTSGAAVSAANPLTIAAVPSASATFAPSWSPNAAAVSGNALKSGGGNLRSFVAVNRNGSARYFQIWDSLTVGTGTLLVQIPLDGSTAPAITSKGMGADFFGPQGIAFATGLSFGFSTTNTTYSAATAADHDAFIAYK